MFGVGRESSDKELCVLCVLCVCSVSVLSVLSVLFCRSSVRYEGSIAAKAKATATEIWDLNCCGFWGVWLPVCHECCQTNKQSFFFLFLFFPFLLLSCPVRVKKKKKKHRRRHGCVCVREVVAREGEYQVQGSEGAR